MAMVVEQQSNFKHFCRICKKGFGCGRALGGHMRAHGIGDENEHIDNDEDPGRDWDDKIGENSPPGNKRMYALRTNPNRLKSCRICQNCGKEFLSWKAFLEHGKCSLDNVESLVSSPGLDADQDEEEGRGGYGWSKGKRSKRAKLGNSNSNCPSSEEEDLANCLVMLSTARVDPLVAETEESCASASREEERHKPVGISTSIANRVSSSEKAKGVAKGMFECKACKKVFTSHQALGGHRASHKKVKGCFAAKLEDLDESLVDEDVITHEELFVTTLKSTSIVPYDAASNPTLMAVVPSKRKSKVHECSICHRIFSSGQALGGHKRSHWVTSNSPDNTSMAKFNQFQEHSQQLHRRPTRFNKSEPLDLNLPAPVDDIAGGSRHHDPENPLSFEASAPIYIPPWIGVDTTGNSDKHQNHHYYHNNYNDNNNTTNNSINALMQNVDDEADSKVKLAKLSDLKDMNLGGGSSPWLQVGIGSNTKGSSNDPFDLNQNDQDSPSTVFCIKKL